MGHPATVILDWWVHPRVMVDAYLASTVVILLGQAGTKATLLAT